MAGDWIKMRTDLYRSPKVCVMADLLMAGDGELARYVDQHCQRTMTVTRNVMRNVTVGALVSVWGVMRTQGKPVGEDLFCSHVTVSVLDDIADLPGLGAAMAHIGWVVESDNGITFPRFFADHNVDPEEANKKKNAERQARFRDRQKGNGDAESNVTSNVTITHREEKRREEVVVLAKTDATVVELHPEQQQSAGLRLDNPTAFAKSVAEAYAAAYGVGVPPVPLMTAMSIAQRIDFYPATADLSWWEVYFQLCFEDLYLTNRDSLDQPLGKKAARFDNLVSEKTISTMVDRNNREAAHA